MALQAHLPYKFSVESRIGAGQAIVCNRCDDIIQIPPIEDGLQFAALEPIKVLRGSCVLSQTKRFPSIQPPIWSGRTEKTSPAQKL